MAARLAAVLPRFAVLVVVLLLATTAVTFAAQRTIVAPPATQPAATEAPKVLVVPDVRGQAYVFAKGILEDGGFAWRVDGSVRGYAANTVAAQAPLPGTRVIDTGAPTIVLRLRRNASYAQEGTPENEAPFHGSPIRLADRPAPKAKPAATAPAPAPGSRPANRPAARSGRPPAFTVAGAPREPVGEMSLPVRARRLEAWLSTHRRPTSSNVREYLYQHAWIVTGAKFGWWRGAEALRILVRADRRAQRLWGIGAKSELVASRALKLVEARSR